MEGGLVMFDYRTKLLDVLVVFFIGFTAGVSPFLFMQILPSLLNPDLVFLSINWGSIVITGVLIGVISAIIFSPDFKKKQPQEIFFHALGIPAVLIASVSNLSTQFEAQAEISAAKVNASTSILLQPKDEEVVSAKDIILISSHDVRSQGAAFISKAYAGQRPGFNEYEFANTSYLVTVGEYETEQEAKEQFHLLNERTLMVEKFLPKSLRIYRISERRYVISYAKFPVQEEARKAYQLLRINDPYLSVNILHLR